MVDNVIVSSGVVYYTDLVESSTNFHSHSCPWDAPDFNVPVFSWLYLLYVDPSLQELQRYGRLRRACPIKKKRLSDGARHDSAQLRESVVCSQSCRCRRRHRALGQLASRTVTRDSGFETGSSVQCATVKPCESAALMRAEPAAAARQSQRVSPCPERLDARVCRA
uniref:SFRICE_030819 n=1 Tax=Spodoptera frugiperda TaxID=7108 RepID=A0A2H1WPW8_SPOFR